jgi:hypothetical protein
MSELSWICPLDVYIGFLVSMPPFEGTGKYITYGIHIRKECPWNKQARCFISAYVEEPTVCESNGGGTTFNMVGHVAPLALIGAVGYYCLS